MGSGGRWRPLPRTVPSATSADARWFWSVVLGRAASGDFSSDGRMAGEEIVRALYLPDVYCTAPAPKTEGHR